MEIRKFDPPGPIRLTFKRHPKTAWSFTIIAALMMAIVALNQLVSAFKTLGLM